MVNHASIKGTIYEESDVFKKQLCRSMSKETKKEVIDKSETNLKF